ncbi:MAG: RsmD family RNA methyltransferase [Bacteroidales bacterium]|nr:RsmD family RNA methyltransferase [Bacteroidales bacterium]
MEICIHDLWNEYELIDCGNGRKLERFGEITLIRPEITATGKPHLSNAEWTEMANAEFVETSKNSGKWNIFKQIPETWRMEYISRSSKRPLSVSRMEADGMSTANQREVPHITAELSLTTSKHIGIFPEQIINWQFIERESANFGRESFLNLFGYTGLSTVFASNFFDKATHIDSIKKVVEWTRRNAENSGRSNIRLITEDAQKFVEREIKRGNTYDGIILDPPAIGSGAKNEKWIFDEMIENLLSNVNQIVRRKSFIIMNLYSHSVFGMEIRELLHKSLPNHNIEMCEEVKGLSKFGGKISHGMFVWLKS